MTMVNLLMRFYDIQAGKIAIDGGYQGHEPKSSWCLSRVQDTWPLKGLSGKTWSSIKPIFRMKRSKQQLERLGSITLSDLAEWLWYRVRWFSDLVCWSKVTWLLRVPSYWRPLLILMKQIPHLSIPVQKSIQSHGQTHGRPNFLCHCPSLVHHP